MLEPVTRNETTSIARGPQVNVALPRRPSPLPPRSPHTCRASSVDPATGTRRSAFHPLTSAREELNEECFRRGRLGISRLELFTPDSWAPLPGSVIEILLGEPTDAVHITNPGSTLVKPDC